jgi:hypothetical protein
MSAASVTLYRDCGCEVDFTKDGRLKGVRLCGDLLCRPDLQLGLALSASVPPSNSEETNDYQTTGEAESFSPCRQRDNDYLSTYSRAELESRAAEEGAAE